MESNRVAMVATGLFLTAEMRLAPPRGKLQALEYREIGKLY